MVPLLKKASISGLVMCSNRKINTESFTLIAEALNGGSIEALDLRSCSIDDITALERVSLPHLRNLQ